MARPGRMRFEYTDPPRFEIVADGRSVAIVDQKLNTQDEYFIGQTPLKFLLSDHIDLARDTQVLNVAARGQDGHDRARGSGGARRHGASFARLRRFDLRAEAMDGDRRAGLPDGRHPVQCRSEDQAGPGPVPHRREPAGQSARQPPALTMRGLWAMTRCALRRPAPGRASWLVRRPEPRMTFSIATWNINSVRLRIDLVARYLPEHQPDVLCLQETKCPDGNFPLGAFRDAGYPHIAINGQKGYHGVAIVSRLPLADLLQARLLRQGRRAPSACRPRRRGARARTSQFLRARGRRRAGPRDQRQVRPQARLRRRNGRLGRRTRGRRRNARSWSAISTSRRSNTTSGATSRFSTSSATRRSRSTN